MLRYVALSVWVALLLVVAFKCKTTNDSILKGTEYEPLLSNVHQISCSSGEQGSRSTRLAIHLGEGLGIGKPAIVLGFIHAPQHANGKRLAHASLAESDQSDNADGGVNYRYRFSGWSPTIEDGDVPRGVNYQLIVTTTKESAFFGKGAVEMSGLPLANDLKCTLVPGPATPNPHRWLKQPDGSFLAHGAKGDSDELFALLPGQADKAKTFAQNGLNATCDFYLPAAEAVQGVQCHVTYAKDGEITQQGTSTVFRTVSKGQAAVPLWNLLGKGREKPIKGGKERSWSAVQTPLIIYCARKGGVSKTECFVEGRFEG